MRKIFYTFCLLSALSPAQMLAYTPVGLDPLPTFGSVIYQVLGGAWSAAMERFSPQWWDASQDTAENQGSVLAVTPTPTGNPIQSFCDAATVADLVAIPDTGGTIDWYDAATGGNLLNAPDVLADGDLVFAEQTIGGVPSADRLQVLVEIYNYVISTDNGTNISCSGEPLILSVDYLSNGPFISEASFVGRHNDLDYYESLINQSFFNAESYAQSVGGHLVSIHSNDDNSFLTNNISTGSYIFGLNDFANEGDFIYTDGTPLDYTRWAPGEPNNQGNEDVIIFRSGSGQWNDIANGYSGKFLFYTNPLFLWSTGEITPAISVSPSSSTTYWVDITSNGITCREEITISVTGLPNTPISAGNQVECEDSPIQVLTAGATADLGQSINWYDAATGGNNVGSPTLNSIGAVTYYAEAIDDITGCVSNSRTAVTLEIIAAPASPSSGGDQSECAESPLQTLNAEATIGSGQSLVWYDSSSGGNAVASPILNNIGSITYYAEAVDDATGCVSPNRTAVALAINYIPSAPISNGDITQPEELPIQIITASVQITPGESVIWYDAALGGSVITDPSLSAVGTITYYAESVVDATGCTSLNRTPVTLTILAAPDPPTAAPIQSFCDVPGAIASDLIATGTNIQWYDAPTGGNLLDPSSFLVNSQLVYASQTVSGIESLTRTQVLAHLTSTFVTGNTELCLGESVELQAGWDYIEIPNALRSGRYDDAFAFRTTIAMNYNDAQNFAQSFGGNLASVRSELDYLNYNSFWVENLGEIYWFGLNDLFTEGAFSFSDGTPVTYTNWSPGQPDGLTPDQDGVYFGLDGTWSDADIAEEHKFFFQLRNIGPDFLWSTGETTEYITLTPTVTAAYWIDVTINGNTCRYDFTLTVNDPPTPGITNNTGGATQLTCDITTISLTATGGVAYSWFDGVTIVSSIADLSITTPGTYTVTVTDTNGCSDTAFVVITENLEATADITTNTGNNVLTCLIEEIELTASGGNTYSWSTGETTAMIIVNSPGTYTVTVTGINGCNDSTGIIITFEGAPDAPISGGDQSACEIDPIQTLTPEASVPTGQSITWYDAPAAGNIVADPSWSVVGSVTYYAQASDDATSCISLTRTPVTLEILAAPDAPISGGDQSTCEIDPIQTLTAAASAPAGQSITWYDAPAAGNIVADPSWSAVGSVTYYAQASDDATGCISLTRTPVTLEILAAPDAPTGDSEQTFCNSALLAEVALNGMGLLWYTSPTSFTPLNTNNFVVNGTIYYASQTISGCESNERFAVQTYLDQPEPPQGIANQVFCNSAIVADLTIQGTDILWYDSITSEVPLALDAALIFNNSYYASQTIEGCESQLRFEVSVDILIPQAPSGESLQSTCDLASIEDLEVEGAQIRWYNSLTDGIELDPETQLTNGQTYYASQTISGCESIDRLAITVDLFPCEIKIYNAMSLNGNGQNEFMVIDYVAFYPINTLEIYTRDGNLVYQQNQYGTNGNVFRGIANVSGVVGEGNALPTGSYLYVFQYVDPFREISEVKKGFLTLTSNE